MRTLPGLVFLKVSSAFLLGVILAHYYQLHDAINWITGVCITAAMLITFRKWLFKTHNQATQLTISSLCLYILLFCLGILRSHYYTQIHDPAHFSNTKFQNFLGTIQSEPQLDGNRVKFVASINHIYNQKWIEAVGDVNITAEITETQNGPLEYGDVFVSNAKINPILPPLNPGEFNVQRWLKSKNIFHSSYINEEDFAKTNLNNGHPLLKFAYKLRKKQVERYQKILKDTTAFSIVSTLVLGYRSDLSPEVLNAFSATGTIHALSVSGAHVAILFMFLHHALFFLKKNRWKIILKLILIISILWFYALISGFSASVLRSVIMISLYIIAKYLSKNQSGLNIMFFSAFALMFYHPPFVADVGFQLSYFAVVGLLVIQPIIQTFLHTDIPWIKYIWDTVSMSVAAQVSTLPLSIFYFQQFPIYFLVGNLFILLPLNVIMGLGTIVLLPYGEVFALPLELTLKYTYAGLDWMSTLPFSTLQNIHLTMLNTILLSIAIVLLTISIAFKNTISIFIATCLIMLIRLDHLMDYYKKEEKIIFYSLKNNFAIGFQSNNFLSIISNLKVENSTYRFSLEPSTKLPNIHRSQYTIIESVAPQNAHKHWLLNFKGIGIRIVDQCLNEEEIAQKADILLFTGSNTLSRENLNRLINNNRLVIFQRPPLHLSTNEEISPKGKYYVLMNQKHKVVMIK